MSERASHVLTVLSVVAVCLVAPVGGQQDDVIWAAGADGAIPEGAVQAGKESDGRAVYICRGAFGGATQLGKVASGARSCLVAYRGRELPLKSYEVLTRPVSRIVRSVEPSVTRNRPMTEPARGTPPPGGGRTSVPSTPPDSTTRRGFDEHGRPYVEVRLPDGTIKRTQDNGVTLIHPDGTTQFIPNLTVRMDAPAPTPPSLPSDPARGRAWVERHNADLLDLIRDLVQRDASEMQKFTSGEQQAVGDDVFAQIRYRTTIAEFLATQR